MDILSFREGEYSKINQEQRIFIASFRHQRFEIVLAFCEIQAILILTLIEQIQHQKRNHEPGPVEEDLSFHAQIPSKKFFPTTSLAAKKAKS
jgi:hypothetical protein